MSNLPRALALLSLWLLPSEALATSVFLQTDPLTGARCRNEARQLLARWEAQSPFRWQLQEASGTDLYLAPTRRLGVWIEARRRGARLELRQVTEERSLAVRWTSSCHPVFEASSQQYDRHLLEQSFDDAWLKRIVGKTSAGVVYAWSPHMPFSLMGLTAVRRAASRLGLRVFLTLDPHADSRAAEFEAARFHLSPDSMRRMESLELLYRGLANHFPSIVVFSRGQIRGGVIPGVKDEAGYSRLISRELSSIGRTRR